MEIRRDFRRRTGKGNWSMFVKPPKVAFGEKGRAGRKRKGVERALGFPSCLQKLEHMEPGFSKDDKG